MCQFMTNLHFKKCFLSLHFILIIESAINTFWQPHEEIFTWFSSNEKWTYQKFLSWQPATRLTEQVETSEISLMTFYNH